jgi:predicted phage terminase large subunit-like protein
MMPALAHAPDGLDRETVRLRLFEGLANGLRRDRTGYPDFVPAAWPLIEPVTEFQRSWFVDCIAEHLEAVLRGQIQDLVINLPPRNGKSNLVTVLWPVWAWTEQPWLKWIFVSYASSLSTQHSVDRRRIIESDWYQKKWGSLVKMQPDQNAKDVYENTARGVMRATSTTGSATGFGGDIIVFDDVINPQQAESRTEREKAIRSFDLTFSSRLNDKKKGHRVAVEQRLHKDDLTGHVLKQSGWHHLSLPAIAEQRAKIIFPMSGRVQTREPGDILNPQREGVKELDRQKQITGARGFAAQYQQRPTAEEAAYFRRDKWKFYRMPANDMAESMEAIWQSWDMAFKDTKAGSWVVGGILGAKGPDFYVLDLIRDRMTFTASKTAVRALTGKWAAADAKLIEDKANGPAIIDELSNEIGGIIPVAVAGSKEARAASISPYQESGNIYLPDPALAPWVNDFIEELSDFPHGQNDDQVDFLSQGVRWWLDRMRHTVGVTVV